MAEEIRVHVFCVSLGKGRGCVEDVIVVGRGWGVREAENK